MKGRIVVLGAGYTGRALIHLLEKEGIEVVASNRSPEVYSKRFASVRQIRFDLLDEATWRIPSCDGCVILFPPAPPESVERIAPLFMRQCKKLVVIGTTSSYRSSVEHEILDETAGLDLESPRVRGEEYLRRLGGVVLRSAGIYGPGRNPLDWLRSGRIASLEKYVNLIHVEDLAAVIVAALDRAEPSEHFIVTDGTPRRWKDIAEWAEKKGFVTGPISRGASVASSRRLTNNKLIGSLSPALKRTELFTELEILETEHPTS